MMKIAEKITPRRPQIKPVCPLGFPAFFALTPMIIPRIPQIRPTAPPNTPKRIPPRIPTTIPTIPNAVAVPLLLIFPTSN